MMRRISSHRSARTAFLSAVFFGIVCLFASPPVLMAQTPATPASTTPTTPATPTPPATPTTPSRISPDGHTRPIDKVDPAQDRSQWATLGVVAVLLIGVLVASFMSPKRNVDN